MMQMKSWILMTIAAATLGLGGVGSRVLASAVAGCCPCPSCPTCPLHRAITAR
jgi:hypothetical protein